MSNSLQIQNLNIGGSNDVVECKNKDDIEIDDSNDDDQHSGSSSGDCFGSTGLFTAMWNKKKWRENSNICHQERSQPSSSIVIDRRPTLLNIVQHARVFFEWYWTINNINNYYIQSPMIFSDFKTNNLKKNPALIFFDEYLSWIFDVVAPRPAYIKLKKKITSLYYNTYILICQDLLLWRKKFVKLKNYKFKKHQCVHALSALLPLNSLCI